MSEKEPLLVVDDEQGILELFRNALSSEFNVLCATDGEEALKYFDQFKPMVVILDVGLPGIDGFELCEQLKARSSVLDLAVIFVSGKDSLEEKLRGYAVGGEDYITKPFQLKEVVAKIHHANEFLVQRKKLAEQAKKAKKTALQAMTDTNEYGEILHYVKDTFHAVELEDLATLTLETTARLGVKCSIQLRGLRSSITRNAAGEASPLEMELFETLQNRGRIFDFKQRSMYNYPYASLLCKNMPLDDKAHYGRLKDLLATLVEAADARMVDLHKGEALRFVLGSTKTALNMVESKFTEHERATSDIMESLMKKMQKGLSSLGLTEEQEEFLLELLDDSMFKLIALYSGEVEINRQFNQITDEINRALKNG